MCDILLLDHDALLLATLAEALRDDGFHVRDVHSAAEMLHATDEAAGARMVVFSLDLATPAETDALAAEIRRHLPAVPLIHLTSCPSGHTGYGPDRRDYTLQKPFVPAELGRIARSMIAAEARA